MPNATVAGLRSQINYIRLLKQLGTSVPFPVPPHRGSSTVSILVFSDAGRMSDHEQLSFFACLLVRFLSEGSLFYTLSWISHKSKHPREVYQR